MIYVVTGTCNPYFLRVIAEAIIRKVCTFDIDNFRLTFKDDGSPEFHMRRFGKFNLESDDAEIFFNTYRTVLPNGDPKCLDAVLKKIPQLVFSPAIEHAFLNVCYPEIYYDFDFAFNRDVKQIETMFHANKDFCISGCLHKKFIDRLSKKFNIKVINVKRNPSCDFLFDEQFNLDIYEHKVENFLNIELEHGSVRFEDFLSRTVQGLNLTRILNPASKYCLRVEKENIENYDTDNLEAFNDLAENKSIFSKLGYTQLSVSEILGSK